MIQNIIAWLEILHTHTCESYSSEKPFSPENKQALELAGAIMLGMSQHNLNCVPNYRDISMTVYQFHSQINDVYDSIAKILFCTYQATSLDNAYEVLDRIKAFPNMGAIYEKPIAWETKANGSAIVEHMKLQAIKTGLE